MLMLADSGVITAPFQLFTAFKEADRDKFFGRDDEIRSLKQLTQEANVVLIYGESGTGKTSLVQCGLLNETRHFNWAGIKVRRGDDINTSFRTEVRKMLRPEDGSGTDDEEITELVNKAFIESFQPILFIFDQFEELYIFGTERERALFYKDVKVVLKMGIPCKMLFIMREEFIARVTEFEKVIPGLFRKRLRIELIGKTKCREIIIRSCRRFGILLSPLREEECTTGPEDVPDQVIANVTGTDNHIHLPYLQVFLYMLWKKAVEKENTAITIDMDIVGQVGNMGNVLKVFLEEIAENQKDVNKLDIWKLLKLFVPEKGASRKRVRPGDYTSIAAPLLRNIFVYLETNKVISSCAQELYELAHDSLVPIIQNYKISELRPRLAEPAILGNPYKGLEAYGEHDIDRFYGRQEVVKMVSDKIRLQPLVVIVGNSGVGKSSLIKAGVLPLMEKEGFEVLDKVKGQEALPCLERIKSRVKPDKKYILLIDQYEELITRVTDSSIRQKVTESIYRFAMTQTDGSPAYELKIIITVRADFEAQFSIMKPLDTFWKSGKYIVPPFTREEIAEIIEEPAYQAGLEYSPPSLIDKIADEVYSSQATGLLPLMSFTLSELYKEYLKSGRQDKLLRESDYNALGGVIGGLQTRGDKIYRQYMHRYPEIYLKYQHAMKNIILRMVYLAAGELAGQRVLAEDLAYSTDQANHIVSVVLKDLMESHLILARMDVEGKQYYEPAHDVLVRTWGQIWDWIGQLGKETLFLQSRLSQAISDYEKGGGKDALLWDQNPWLADLEAVTLSDDNWLNQRESGFVTKSIRRKDHLLDIAKKEQGRKLAKNKKLILVLVIFIGLSGVSALYIMRSMTRRTNLIYAALAINKVDTLSDKRFALEVLTRAHSLIKIGNLPDSVFLQALASSNQEIVKLFNKSDLSCRIITHGNLRLSSYSTFKNDSRILAVYNGDDFSNQFVSVLYDANGDSIMSWPHNAYPVANSDLVAVVENKGLRFYKDGTKSRSFPLIDTSELFRHVPASITSISANRNRLLIQGNNMPLILYDSAGGVRELSARNNKDKTIQQARGEFLRNGSILKVENIGLYNGYGSLSNTNLCRVRLITGNDSSSQLRAFYVDTCIVAPDRSGILIKQKGVWAFLTGDGLKRQDLPLDVTRVLFGDRHDILMASDYFLYLYDSNSIRKTALNMTLTDRSLTDLNSSRILQLKKGPLRTWSDSETPFTLDSIFLLDLSLPVARPSLLLSAMRIRDCRFNGNAGQVISVGDGATSHADETDPRSLYQIYDTRTLQMILDFNIYLTADAASVVLNREFQRAVPLVFTPGLYANSFDFYDYFSSANTTKTNMVKKLRLYDVQHPIVRYSEMPDSIINWMENIDRQHPVDPYRRKKVDEYLHYDAKFDWLPSLGWLNHFLFGK